MPESLISTQEGKGILVFLIYLKVCLIILDFLSILGLSPKLGEYMSTNVNLVESFLQKDFFNINNIETYISDQLKSLIILESTYEEKVKKFSIFINEIKFQIGVNYLLEKTNRIRCQEILSYLAITSLESAIKIVFLDNLLAILFIIIILQAWP